MAEWRVASDGETLAWQRRQWTGCETGEQRLDGSDAAALSGALRQIFSGRARTRDTLRVVLGSQHIRVAALPWPGVSLSAAEQGALLLQRWRERLDDATQWWLGVEHSGAMRLATAVRHDLLHALEAAARGAGIRPLACLPASGLAMGMAGARPEARIAIAEGPRETVVTLAHGRLSGLSSAWRGGPTLQVADGATAAILERGVLRQGIEIRLDGGPRTWLEWL